MVLTLCIQVILHISIKLGLHDVFKVGKEDWHQIYNPYAEECRIIEIQYGDETSEEDIERLEFYEGNNDE